MSHIFYRSQSSACDQQQWGSLTEARRGCRHKHRQALINFLALETSLPPKCQEHLWGRTDTLGPPLALQVEPCSEENANVSTYQGHLSLGLHVDMQSYSLLAHKNPPNASNAIISASLVFLLFCFVLFFYVQELLKGLLVFSCEMQNLSRERYDLSFYISRGIVSGV